MGVDFIRKVAPTHRKSWDRARVDLGTPDLFIEQPSCASRTVAAVLENNHQLQEGDNTVIQIDGSELIVMQGLSKVARISNPPPYLFEVLKESFGVARGTVEQVYEIAGVVEISVC